MNRPMVHRSCAIAGMLAAALAGAGCGKPGGSAAPARGPASGGITISGAGATFPYPIYSKWFQAYSQAHPSVTFNYQAVGSGAGIAQYKAGTVDFGATDAPLTDSEVQQLPRPTLHLPTVAGAVVLTYNLPGVTTGLKLSGDVIADIYLGKIKEWNDPRIASQNPGASVPAMPIAVVHRADGSGTTYIFTSYLSAVSPEWKNRVSFGKSVNWPVGLGGNQNAGVAGDVQHSKGAIGYVELAYALQNKLPVAAVRNRAGQYVEASTATTTAAAAAGAPEMKKDVRVSIVDGPGTNTYPIAGFTYLLVPKAPQEAAKGTALVDFLKWAFGPGQQMAEQLEYAPLPPEVVKLNLAALESARVPASAGH